MKRGRTFLLIKFSGSASVAALVMALTCGSPGVVLAEVDVLMTPPQTAVGPEGTLQTPKTESESANSPLGSIDGPSVPAASPAELFDAAADMSSAENSQAEPVSIADDQTGGMPQQHVPAAAISSDEPSSLTDEETGQTSPVGVSMTSPENVDLATASVAESKAPVQQSLEDPLASGTSQITESETLASPPVTEIAGAANANIAEDQTPSTPQSRQEPLAAISNDEPSSLTDEESGQINPVGVNTTSPENADLPTASTAESKRPDVQQFPEHPLASGTDQITGTETLAIEIAGASNDASSAQAADHPRGSGDMATPLK